MMAPRDTEGIRKVWVPSGHLRFKQKFVSGMMQKCLQQLWRCYATGEAEWRDVVSVPADAPDVEVDA